MALGFGLIGTEQRVQTADYKSAGSHQSENVKYVLITNIDTYNVIHTVTEGKTFYCSGLLISRIVTGVSKVTMATGGSGSETPILVSSVYDFLAFALPTPLKFSSGTRITVKTNSADDVNYSMIGWEE